ncbi:glutamate ligase [Bifidobacterium sp. DSM 109960]|uniref:Lipid II isoglutaminyl synthase (glutamine-hydrolyzing) subunit MurT n=1 Tax=Bifidobacterium erythrocebi TaxID=2675325 RepID=A0A7Y0EVK5_9BIFI|nr:glutamate ligase [Bifidobacterium sp. DSM 109960]
MRRLARLTHHGGSALPGKVVERIDPGFLARTLSQLPYGVVLVSGTNGKTTTTRMVASMLSDLGLRVFTNPTGSNFTRGVVSALLTEVSLTGKLDADIAVLELDEAYAVHFVKQVRPKYSLLLNVMRDQLDRFGEIDNTARLLGHVAEATTGTVVLNREDPRIAALAGKVPHDTAVRYFGLAKALKHYFPTDDEMNAELTGAAKPAAGAEQTQAGGAAAGEHCADVTLVEVRDHAATFLMDGRNHDTDVKLEGVYNLYNAAAALALVRAVAADVPQTAMRSDADSLIKAVSQVTPAFGRGEVIEVNGSPVELLLVKNPMGFRLSLASFAPEGCDTMIAINDEYADGRDMSWLWDVDFTSLRTAGVAMVSGVRAWDMALRLGYEEVPVAKVDTDFEHAVTEFVTANPDKPKHMYCTYTAMLKARAVLGHITEVSDAGVGR